MTSPLPSPLTLTCTHCHGVFRVTPRHAEFEAQRIDCMRCGHALMVPEFQSERGWHHQATRDIFRPNAPAAAPSQPTKHSPAPPTHLRRASVQPEFIPLTPGSKALTTRQVQAKLPEEEAAELARLLERAKALANPPPLPPSSGEPDPRPQLQVPAMDLPLNPLTPPPHALDQEEPQEEPELAQGSPGAAGLGAMAGLYPPPQGIDELADEGVGQVRDVPRPVALQVQEASARVVKEDSEEQAVGHDAGHGALGTRHVMWPLTVVALVCGCMALGGGMLWQRDRAADSMLAMTRSNDDHVIVPRALVQHEAVETASTILHLAIRQNFEDAGRKRDVALELVEQGKDEQAMLLLAWMWQGGIRDAQVARAYTTVLIRSEQWAKARRIALHALTQDGSNAPLAALWQEAIARDPELHPTLRTIRQDEGVDRIRALGGGKSLSFKFEEGGKVVAAFKPAQTEWVLGWQAEIAAYTLCQAIPCHFAVPKSSPVRIKREDFEALYARFRSTKQTEYMGRFGELVWRREKGEDGVEADYLYGVLKEWVPDFVDWPIEYTEVWAGWLDATASSRWTRRDPQDALGALKWRQDGRYYEPIMERSHTLRTRDIARGISGLLLFDYLTNNWDRFSNVEGYYGVNNQLRAGEFLSLDNGAAFHTQNMQSVERRFEQVSRFSKSLVTALRLAEPSTFSPILFPEPEREDAALRLRTFWLRRQQALANIDQLAQKHGKEEVLFFK